MKGIKLIVALAGAVLLVAAAICAVVVFQEELMKLFNECKEYCCSKAASFKKDEFADFADM